MTEILTAREVPLGGLRAMTVRRTLPQRQRSLIGGWCFVDHYGPDDVTTGPGMVVPPHPHTGLQTVSWLFTGEIEHRDSAGHHAMVRPGEVNLMTAGRGISHSEYVTSATTTLHGAQLWVALPDHARHTEPAFEHYAPALVSGSGWQARVFIGEAFGSASPVRTYSPLLGIELTVGAGRTVDLDLDPTFEHGVLVDRGAVDLDGAGVKPTELAYLEPGRAGVGLRAVEDSRLLLLGGEPLGEQIVMWWNFIGRNHDEIAAFREEWQRLLDSGASERFRLPADDPRDPIPAPVLPNLRLTSRG